MMTVVLTLATAAILSHLARTSVLLAWLSHAQTPSSWRSGTDSIVLWARMSVLLVLLLSACSGSDASSPSQTPATSPPLTVTSSPHLTASSTTDTTRSSDWPTYHHDSQRTGFVANTPTPHRLTASWTTSLDGAVYAEPLIIGQQVLVATEGDSLYALDATTGHIQWRSHVGTPVPLSTLPCGNIDPLGITGTPVYDPTTGLVFATAEISGPAHILVGVDITTGQLKVRRSVDTDGMDPRAHQQRSALTLANGRVYFTYGGLDGDCSDYIGRVVASRTDGLGPLLVYRVPTPREGDIWATPGASVDATGNLYVAVGNGAITQGAWDHSDAVLKLSPTLQLEDAFAPAQWSQDNANDADLGSQGPLLLPNQFLFAAGKSGLGYVLRTTALGGVGGQVDVQPICRSFGGVSRVGSTVFVPCTDGLRQLTVDSQGQMHLGWHADQSIVGSPVVGGQTVYSLSGGVLSALGMQDGQIVASVSVGQQTNRFATPTISGTRIFVGTQTGVTAVAIT